MILVDTALRAPRGRGPPDPRRPDRRRLHGPGPREPDRPQRPRNAGGRHLRPPARAGARESATTPSSACPVVATDPGRGRGRDPRRAASSSPTTRSCSAARSRSTCSSTSPARSSSARRSCSRRSRNGKHIVLMNAELDATIGPILNVYAAAGRRHHVRLRRRRAGPADEPRPLGRGPRAHAARDRQRQGPPGPVPQPGDAGAASPRSGARTRRW